MSGGGSNWGGIILTGIPVFEKSTALE